MKVSERIRRLRAQKAWTQPELAEASGITIRTVQRLEAGQSVSAETLKRVAKAFGVPLETLQSPSDQEAQSNATGEFLPRITNGADLAAIIADIYALGPSYDTPKDAEEAERIAGFVRLLQDYGDIWNDLEAADHVHATWALQQELDTLESSGLWVFGARIHRNVRWAQSNGSEVWTWPIAAVRIVSKTSPEIIRVHREARVFGNMEPLGE